MAEPDDPQAPPPAPPSSEWWRRYHGAEPTPWWRWVAQTLGVGPLVDQLTPDPAKRAAIEQRVNADLAAARAKRPAAAAPPPAAAPLPADPLTATVARTLGRVGKEVGQTLKEVGKEQWTPAPEVRFLADQARQKIAADAAAIRPHLPQIDATPVLRAGAEALPSNDLGWFARSTAARLPPIDPLALGVGAVQQGIPNFAVAAAEDATTPVGMAMNLVDPALPLAKAAAGLPLLAKGLGAAGGSLAALPPGFFSRVDRTLADVGKGGITPGRLHKLLSTDAGLAEEAAYRKLNELIAARGGPATTQRTISQAELQAHLSAHPAPEVGRTVLGEPAPPISFEEWERRWHAAAPGQLDEATIRRGYDDYVEQTVRHSQGSRPTKYDRGDLVVPGGEAYRESLTQLRNQPHNPYEAFTTRMEQKYGVGYDWDRLTPDEQAQQSMLWERSQRGAGAMTEGEFRSSHWEQPNVVAHTRYNERVLPPRPAVDPGLRAAYQFTPAERRPAVLRAAEAFEQDPKAAVAELEALSTDEAMGVRFTEGEGSLFPDNTTAINCTNCAEQIIRKLGRGEVYGWADETNPTSVVSGPSSGPQLDLGSGHDFAVVDERYLVDPWAKNVDGSSPRAAWDLHDPADRAEVLRLYGDPASWVHRVNKGPGQFEWVSEAPAGLREGAAWQPPPVAASGPRGHSPQPAVPGERGRFLEEVQSDWHQQGKKAGYHPGETAREDLERRWGAVKDQLNDLGEGETPQHHALRAQLATLTDEWNALTDRGQYGVPDAPFKETWPDLALKQQLLDVAHRPDLSWLGFTGGKTQAARYDLSKQISRLEYEPNDRVLRGYDHAGERVINERVEPDELADYIGKEPAEKLTEEIRRFEAGRAYERAEWTTEIDPETGNYLILDPNGEVLHDVGGNLDSYSTEAGAQRRIDYLLNEELYSGGRPMPTLSGLDLQVGGEGMTHFYDQLLPRRLEKLVKPFGGTVERAPLSARTKAAIDAEMDALHLNPPPGDEYGLALNRLQAERNLAVDDPAWITRLSPEMKEQIRTQGFPLLSLLPPALLTGLLAASQQGEDAGQGGGALGAAALLFVPGMRRPGLTKAGRAAIEEARQYLQHVGLKGPVPRGVLETVLKEAPFAQAHHVTKDLPVEAPLGEARRILLPGEGGRYDLSPPAEARLHGMADIGVALPFQANWGNALDPAMRPAFSHGGRYDPRGAELFGRFFAALSPRTSVPKNAQEAVKVWYDYLRYPGKPFTDERLRELGVGNVRSKADNLTRAILGFDPSGPKVDLFTDYMAGKALLPVPDVHGLYGIGSEHGAIDDVIPELRQIVQQHEGIPAVRGGLTQQDYVRRLVEGFARSLRAYDPSRPMGPLFGSTWEGIRAQKGLSPQGGMIDIYGSRGLAESGAMFDPRALARAIREWGIR